MYEKSGADMCCKNCVTLKRVVIYHGLQSVQYLLTVCMKSNPLCVYYLNYTYKHK